MTTTQATPTQKKSQPGLWFACKLIAEDASLGIVRKGDVAARRLASGGYELHTNGGKVTLTNAQARDFIRPERTIRGEVLYLNATERADVEAGKVWISSN